LKDYPNGRFVSLANLMIGKLESSTTGSAALQGGQPTEPPKIPTTGKLIVRSNVSGDTVTIDGKPLGPTGATPHTLAPGEHTIRVEKPGFEPFETRITLSAGGEETVRAHLPPVGWGEPLDGEPQQSPPQGIVPEMVRIPAGCFQMGSPTSEKERDDDERQHRVCVEGFSLGKYEVTFAEYDRFARATGRKLPGDEGWGRGKRPVINMSWVDATEYAEWLSRETGEKYRLPTEAEWEYAARAGTQTRYFWGDDLEDKLACNFANGADLTAKEKNSSWTTNNCRDGFVNTAPVGTFRPNGFGLYDTAGNVWEWTCSLHKAPYDGTEQRCASKGVDGGRVLRGGSWGIIPRWLRSAARSRNSSNGAYYVTGFRLARAF